MATLLCRSGSMPFVGLDEQLRLRRVELHLLTSGGVAQGIEGGALSMAARGLRRCHSLVRVLGDKAVLTAPAPRGTGSIRVPWPPWRPASRRYRGRLRVRHVALDRALVKRLFPARSSLAPSTVHESMGRRWSLRCCGEGGPARAPLFKKHRCEADRFHGKVHDGHT
ncbi:hypothetical protein CUR178_03896 [Leishmania enriettii]|uniref:Uncharacterized protein n=1 Tax=Leishmania enriettii TaxID=5663 RepID=A0A836KSL3_LEIEN|nr:hypothetical protein CUR178_03896 [Leishmania enriettii]